MNLTKPGKVMEVREVHWLNTDSPMDRTDPPRFAEDRAVQLLNAYFPMVVTESGIVTEVRDEQ